MSGKRQKIQYSLALEPGGWGEPPVSGHQGAEPFVAKPAPESSAVTEQSMEEVCNRENLVRAWKRVRQNKGGPGVDGMTIDDAKDYLREHWPSIRSQLLAGTYQPQPVKRVEIPKPDGGVRKLGVPCVVPWSRKIFRPGQSRQCDGAGGRAGDRQTCAQTHPGVSQVRGDGRRLGQAGGRGAPARRPALAPPEQSRARRSRHGAGPTGAPLLPLRGRLQYLCSQPPRR